MKSKQYIEIKVTGNSEDLSAFIELCKKIEYLCNVGASREIPVYVDGDGSASLQFDFKDTKVEFDKKQFEKELDSGDKVNGIIIGE
jgi:hypothetical protein